MSSIQNFATAQQVSRMINRSEELEKLKTAMSKPGKETRLVFITADGGWGKTRLLYEALWRAGHPKIFPLRGQIDEETSWHIQDKVIVSNVLDLSESRLHLFDEFIDRLRQTFKWHKKATFRSYDPFHTSYRAQRKKHADLSRITKTKEDMYDAFFDDYKQITQTHRLVWAVDTVEQLHFPSVPWLKEKNLLTSDDLEFSIRERLIQLLEEKRLPNTTIILVGRPEGSNKYFKEIRKRIGKNTTIDIIELKLFSLKDTGNYIKQLDEDYHSNPIRPDYDEDSADALKDLAKDRERIEILYRYTEGKPVLLSLFTDILIEGMKIPEALQDTLQDAEERIERDGLEKIQFEIEAAFINQFFYNPNKNDIRSQILIALVRAKRGLDIDRLTFILDSKPGETFQSWQGNPNLREKIKRELSANNPRSLRYLSIVKIGFGGRFILQDELYRIFDKHMLRDDRSKQDEIKARTKLYRQLHSYAKVQIANFRQKQQENRKKDEDSLQWHSPADALTSTFRFLTRAEEDRQIALEEQLLDAQLERLHYKLRLDPGSGISDYYINPADQRQKIGADQAEFQARVELWRFAKYNQKDEYWRAFIPIPTDSWNMLDRIIIADDINRWLKYFFNSHKYRRTIDFAKRVKDTIPKLRLEERDILDDPFFKYERDSWQELAETYIGDDIEESIQSLKEVIEKLKDLLQENFLTNNRFGLSLIIVKMRLRRILGVAYNNLGYSYTTLRQYKKASEQYMYALRYLRDTGFLNMEAITRNNLSRVLAEQGLITRAIRICRNGLELKEKLGYEAPIAVSYSTLALIYNKGMSPENAWVDAAMAVAYFRKLENERGYGLALTHLAEALRRMASSPREKLDKPDELFETAIEAIEKAAKIFINNPERMRLIEVSIEQGCVYREYMHYLKETNQPQYKDYIDDTIFPLEEACNLAGDLSYPYHAIDAHVNLAWAYYYMDEIKKAKGALKTCWNMARDIAEKEHWELIEDAHKPPTAKDMEPQLYKLLGKAWLLKGKIELDEFVRLTRTIKEEEEKTQQEDIHNRSFFDEEVETKEARHQIIHENKGAKRIMKEAAEAFVLSLAYNRLFSARSQYIPVAFDTLYTYLKRFNRVELKDFVSYQTEARDMYHVDQVKPNDLTDMGVFLEQSFGDYSVVLPGLED